MGVTALWLVLITKCPLTGSPSTRTNLLAIFPDAWGGGYRVRERRERSPLSKAAWVASKQPALPWRPAQPSRGSCSCAESEKALVTNQIPRKYSICKWKVGSETVALRVPKIPHPFCPGNWDIPGSQVSPSSRQHRHLHSPRNSPSPSHLTLPLGPRHLGSSPEIHPA